MGLHPSLNVVSSDTRPPMLDKTDFASWQQRIRLYCQGPERLESDRFCHRMRMIGNTARHSGKQHHTSSSPKDIYSFINHYTDAKDIWDNGRQNRGQGNNVWGTGATGYGGAQNRVGNANPGQARQVKCYNYNVEGHIARNCTQPKHPQNSEYFKDKMLLMQAQENGVLNDLVYAYDADVVRARHATTISWQILSSADPVGNEARYLREIGKEAKVASPLEEQQAFCFAFTQRHSSNYYKCDFGTCPKVFNNKIRKQHSPLGKKQVTFEDNAHQVVLLPINKIVRFRNDHFGANIGFMDIMSLIDSFLKQIQVGLNQTDRFIRTDNELNFVNKTQYDYYESVGNSPKGQVAKDSHSTTALRERNPPLVEAARTLRIFQRYRGRSLTDPELIQPDTANDKDQAKMEMETPRSSGVNSPPNAHT
ncbi:integrase, catalytic region, zinc finger, CCHC-type containing protein [Tanacetum coccineum]